MQVTDTKKKKGNDEALEMGEQGGQGKMWPIHDKTTAALIPGLDSTAPSKSFGVFVPSMYYVMCCDGGWLDGWFDGMLLC